MRFLETVEQAAAVSAINGNRINWRRIKKDPAMYAHNTTVRELEKIITRCKEDYYTRGKPSLTDAEYDTLEDYLRVKKPNSKALRVGTQSVELNKVKLPVTMYSLDKVKTEEALLKFIARNKKAKSFVLSDKLDGISWELIVDAKGVGALYTRGDGEYGKDITGYLPHIKGLPKVLPKNIKVRGELIMSESAFEKWSGEYINARNMVGGITNKKSVHKALADVQAIAYEQLESKKPLSAQLANLKAKGFTVVTHKVVDSLEFNALVDALNKRATKCPYAIDGIVVSADVVYATPSGNPTHAIAFKQNLESDHMTVKVTGVTWQLSRHGKWIPVVNIEPTFISGVTVTNATAHNAQYIVDNKINAGTVISIVRSGKVIPYIAKVVKPSRKASMPPGEVEWRGAHLYAVDAGDDEELSLTQLTKVLTYFFSTLGVEGLKSGSIAKLISEGYDSVAAIKAMKQADWKEVLGVNGGKIYTSMKECLDHPPLDLLMAASGCFEGLSTSRLSTLVAEYPNILSLKFPSTVNEKKLYRLSGWGEGIVSIFTNGIAEFKALMKEAKLTYSQPEEPESDELAGVVVVFTGFRDAEMKAEILNLGGSVKDGITRDTTVIISKPGNSSSKLDTARERGIPILTPEQFRKKYL